MQGPGRQRHAKMTTLRISTNGNFGTGGGLCGSNNNNCRRIDKLNYGVSTPFPGSCFQTRVVAWWAVGTSCQVVHIRMVQMSFPESGFLDPNTGKFKYYCSSTVHTGRATIDVSSCVNLQLGQFAASSATIVNHYLSYHKGRTCNFCKVHCSVHTSAGTTVEYLRS
jgi:hypothetical protein